MVLPAHAGVILEYEIWKNVTGCITRTCGGDPYELGRSAYGFEVLPAHAGVILKYPSSSLSLVLYYPHMRG